MFRRGQCYHIDNWAGDVYVRVQKVRYVCPSYTKLKLEWIHTRLEVILDVTNTKILKENYGRWVLYEPTTTL